MGSAAARTQDAGSACRNSLSCADTALASLSEDNPGSSLVPFGGFLGAEGPLRSCLPSASQLELQMFCLQTRNRDGNLEVQFCLSLLELVGTAVGAVRWSAMELQIEDYVGSY